MTNIIASQWLKLRRPGVLAALIAGSVVTALATVLAVTAAESDDRGPGVGNQAQLSLDDLTSSHGLADALGRSGTLLGVVVLALTASAVGTEYTYGTLRNLLCWESRRIRLLTGTWLALAGAIVAGVAVASTAGSIAGTVAAWTQGHSTAAWATTTGISDLLAGIANLAVAAIGWSLFGALLALAFRSPATAIGVGVAYVLPFETILDTVSDDVGRWLPGQLLTALAQGGNDTASYPAAGLTLTAYAALVTGPALRSFRRQDVTA
jgi:ABC-2 type transport system permease protein